MIILKHLPVLKSNWKHSSGFKAAVVLSLIGLIGIYQEFLSHHYAASYFLDLKPLESASRYLRVLVVADPQLIGYNNELPGILGSIARYDADKYLERSFAIAVRHHQPDMIIFLGDLFDEGSMSSEEQYIATVDRFRNVFPRNHGLPFFYVVGDNDVGGEGAEPYSKSAERVFRRFFDTKEELKNIAFHFARFLQANVMSGEYDTVGQLSQHIDNTDILSVLVSHVPLLNTISFEKLLDHVRPDLILSAHDHKARILNRNDVLQSTSISWTPIKPGSREVFSWIIKKGRMVSERPAVEIVSPTCSYRMGVRHMGYGALIIEQLKSHDVLVQYTIFWSVDRYSQLYFYLFLLVVLLLVITFLAAMRCNVRLLRRCLSFVRIHSKIKTNLNLE